MLMFFICIVGTILLAFVATAIEKFFENRPVVEEKSVPIYVTREIFKDN